MMLPVKGFSLFLILLSMMILPQLLNPMPVATSTPTPLPTLDPSILAQTATAFYSRQTRQAQIITNTPTSAPALQIPLEEFFATSNDPWNVVTQAVDGITMVLVPAGCFMMGSTDEQIQDAGDGLLELFADEQPVHEQCFDAPFWIDQTEVTQADFERLGGEKANENGFDGDDRPVENITWFEARDFCALRGMHLPTEREWEYAARGPDNVIFPWGDVWDDDLAIWDSNSRGQTANVGSIPEGASWVGALDMSGNVWEWVSTIFGVDNDFDTNFSELGEQLFGYPYAHDQREQDSDSIEFSRILRGGSWNNYNPIFLRAAVRGRYQPDHWHESFGFRCAMSWMA